MKEIQLSNAIMRRKENAQGYWRLSARQSRQDRIEVFLMKGEIQIRYGSATVSDVPAIEKLLVDCGPSNDGIEGLTDNCLVARLGSRIVGTVAMQPCGRSALLRSLAVAPDCRGRALGRSLSAKMASHARLLGVEQLFLLTSGAEKYFARLGFKRAKRSQAR